jgi:ABC-type oligopeptide transport system substrate-binding subunit
VNKTKRSVKLLSLVAAASLLAAACGGDDDDSADDEPADSTEEPAAEPADDAEEPAAEPADDMEEPAEEPADDMEEPAAEPADSGDSGDSGDDYDWTDPLRRQAISMAIDRQAIADVVFLGGRAPADDFWPPSFAGYRGGDACANLQYNPEAAKALWDEAGGTVGPITMWFNSGSGHEVWVEAIANQVKENLGVEEVNFESLEFADYLDALEAGEVNGPFRLGWLMDYPSPGNFLGPIHGTAGSSNNTGYSNPDFDAAVAAGDALPLDEAIGDYQAAGDILCEDMPVIPVYFGKLQGVWNAGNVANVSFDPFQALNVTEVEDTNGDGEVSMYICEPQNGLFGQMTGETCGSEVVNGIFSGLWSLDKESGEIVYDKVASSVETTDDGTNWVITLNDGWTFHDGTPVTASSFVDAWNWAALGANAASNQYFLSILGIQGYDDLNPAEGEEAAATEMSGLVATDDQTIEIALDAPFPQLPLVLLYNAFNPLPEVFYDDPEGFGEAPIGNGPFMLPEGGSWEHDVQVALVVNPDYAGVTPKIDALTYKIYSTDTTGYNDLRSGALDIMDTVPQAELGNFKDEFPDSYVEEATSSFAFMGFPIDLELVQEWNS